VSDGVLWMLYRNHASPARWHAWRKGAMLSVCGKRSSRGYGRRPWPARRIMDVSFTPPEGMAYVCTECSAALGLIRRD